MGCDRRVAGARGFTLIETLVALLIAAIGAAVVLSHVRTLMLRSEREQAHQLAALQLLNDSLRLSHGGPPASAPQLEGDELVIEAAPAEGWPTVRVWNFSTRGETLPPIAIAYTPFQLFGVSRDRYTLHAVAPGLKSPGSARADAGGPALSSPMTAKPPVAGGQP
jgi:prepilin-type N-terminal cleavage/methylation domain-containing protein